MRRRLHPIAIELDNMVESFMDAVEDLLQSENVEYNLEMHVEPKLRELRKRWLAEQTARAVNE